MRDMLGLYLGAPRLVKTNERNTATGVKRLVALFISIACACSAQTLLFKSGFESNTALGSIPSGQTNSYEQPLSGTDTSTGFTWPIPAFAPTLGGIHLNGEPDALSNHFFNSIQTLTGHTGASTRALFVDIEGYANNQCCPQAVFESASLKQPVHAVYYSYWLMYPSSLAAQIAGINAGYGREVSGWKSNHDYRETFDIGRTGTSGSTLHAHIQADAGGKQASAGAGCPHADWITGATVNDCQWFRMQSSNTEYTIPFGQWFHVEIYMNRVHGPGGRYFAAINGHTVADFNYSFDSYGIDNEEVADLYWVNLYSSYFPMSHWIDDLEIWDAPPCASLPCDSQTGNLPASFTSYPAAVGTVGTPFRFQPVTTNNPTSWRYNGYGSTGMPPGLSLNTSSGLISGTPTSSGTYQIYLDANNAAGGGTQVFEFQINSTLQAPVIKTFAPYPATIASGGSSTIFWNVLGAGTVSLSIDQNIGAVGGLSGFKAVNPNATTTYTLTVSNAAGTATASTTVNVSGSTSLPTIASLTATPSAITSGTSSTLAWSTSGATALSIDQGVGTVTGTLTKTVSPTVTTMYTFTASNSAGSVTKSTTVGVTGSLPVISSFTASPATISSGASSGLSWTTTGATSLSIDQGIGTVTGLTSMPVSPSTTTTYALTATNSIGSVTESVTVNVPTTTQSKVGSALIIE